MDRGLKDILSNWSLYRDKLVVTSQELSWFNRSKELIKVYERNID
jgi:hypothetical protein